MHDEALRIKGRRRRTLPPSLLGSTIRPARLNDRVRDGNGCDPRGKAADQKENGFGNAIELNRAAAQAMGVVQSCVYEDRLNPVGLAKPLGRLVLLG